MIKNKKITSEWPVWAVGHLHPVALWWNKRGTARVRGGEWEWDLHHRNGISDGFRNGSPLTPPSSVPPWANAIAITPLWNEWEMGQKSMDWMEEGTDWLPDQRERITSGGQNTLVGIISRLCNIAGKRVRPVCLVQNRAEGVLLTENSCVSYVEVRTH